MVYKNLTDNIMLNVERMNAFFLRSRIKQGYLLSPFTLIQHSTMQVFKVSLRDKCIHTHLKVTKLC